MQRIRIEIELSGDEAWALAQFLKRAGYDQYRRLAADDDEGDKMRDAGEVVRRVLAEAGCAPR
jgi:hypothetical protein